MALVDPPWFVKRRLGWGLSPGTRQGWIVTAVFAMVSVGSAIGLARRPMAFAVAELLISVAFVVVAVMTGEAPGRRSRRR